jgi:Uma2 family endonuclease
VHVQIVGNLVGALVNATVDGPCVVLPSSMKVYAPVGDSNVYPHVSVVRGQPAVVGDGTDVIANPTVIVEVLSDATELFDRGEKFGGYRAVPSVSDYLLVVHDRVRVEHYIRGADDTWVLPEHGTGSRLRLAGVAGELASDEIYRNVSPLNQLPASVSTRSRYVLGECHPVAWPRQRGPTRLASRSAG